MKNSMLATKGYLTISYGDTPLGTLRLTLRPDIVPQTVENFVHFLTAPRGYRNSTFHRIIPKFMAQAGDFINHDGTGSTSIYGRSFADENFHLSHSQRGVLSMANSGKDTNGCQFFISFCPTAHLDGKHVVFGHVDWREDGESADVLDKLERVRTDRRNGDRPMQRVQIVDCGILDDNNNKAKNTATATAGGGGKNNLAGEAKKNKLLQAYGQKNPATNADTDEIDLDDEEEEEQQEEKIDKNIDIISTIQDAGEIDLDDEHDGQPLEGGNNQQQLSTEAPPLQNNAVSSKKAALQKRLAALRKKINQSRTLNRREVHAEATRMGTEEASLKERKRQNKQDRNSKQAEYDAFVVGKLQSVGGGEDNSSADSKAEQKRLASLSQPAFDSIRQMNAQSEKKERSLYQVNDYYNPEGQYSNYERNLKSIRHRGTASATTDSYDPTMASYVKNNDVTNSAKVLERDGAKRLATEMKRRVDKKINKKRKVEFDEADVSYINDRNKRFNQKIGRNFDEHTAEIRQNLERGTAL